MMNLYIIKPQYKAESKKIANFVKFVVAAKTKEQAVQHIKDQQGMSSDCIYLQLQDDEALNNAIIEEVDLRDDNSDPEILCTEYPY